MFPLDIATTALTPIGEFDSVHAAAASLAWGSGQVYVHVIRIEAGGQIGPHPTGFAQLFLVLSGDAWVAGPDGRRVPRHPGQGVLLARGELHSKGSTGGVTALMLQVDTLDSSTVGAASSSA